MDSNIINFLTRSLATFSSRDVYTEWVVSYLQKLEEDDFKSDAISITPVIKKYISYLNFRELYDYDNELIKLSEALTSEIENLNKIIDTGLVKEEDIDDQLEKCKKNNRIILTRITDAIIDLNKRIPGENAYGAFKRLYTPEHSNKQAAIELIEKAIQLIDSDTLLPKKPKDQILKRLKKALNNLKSEKTDWAYYFGIIKEVTIILAALVTIAGSEYNISSLVGAKDKLEEAINIIEITCINQKYIEYESHTTNIFVEEDDIKKLPEKVHPESDKE